MNQEIKIFSDPLSTETVKQMAEATFGEFVKGVVDLQKQVLGLGGGLHADIEQILLEQGSQQTDLWGINLYPEKHFPEMIEFDSLINIRPRQNNRSRGVEDEGIRKQIIELIIKLVK